MINWTKTETRAVKQKRYLLVRCEQEYGGGTYDINADPADIIEAIRADVGLREEVENYLGTSHICKFADEQRARAEKAEAALAAAEKERETAIALCTESVRKSNKELGCALAEIEALKMERDEARHAGKEVCLGLDAARAEGAF